MLVAIRSATLIAATLLPLVGCLPGPTVEPVPFEDPNIRIGSIALMRTTWDGTRPDAFCRPDIGNTIDWHLKQDLQKRGYQVLPLTVAELDNSYRPDPAATLSFDQLQSETPQNADAIMRLRIVEYLDANLCDTAKEGKSLAITGIAEIFHMKTGSKVWETRQLCNDISGTTSDVVFACTTQLTRRIVTRLPAPE